MSAAGWRVRHRRHTGNTASLAPRDAETEPVDLTQCPYDSTPVEAEAYSGGSVLLDCPCCGAAWEWHNALLRRVREPNRTAVMAARNAGPRHPRHLVEAPVEPTTH